MKYDIGLIGLAVMGQNLVLNIRDHGFSVATFNRSYETTAKFITSLGKENSLIAGAKTLEEFVSQLSKPRRIILLIKAGKPVDDMITMLLPLLDKGDLIIDGGNSYFEDSVRRCKDLQNQGYLFIGCGVSGGEEGARKGPSLMPGGNAEAWPLVKNIFTRIAARTEKGESCSEWMGPEGAGHFVKMVHNGIEYGDMQLIAEIYHLMRDGLHLDQNTIIQAFQKWNKTELDSYLIEISAEILSRKEPDGTFTVNTILDAAGQKGTGKWVSQNALDTGVPLTLISEAVFSRYLSALVDERKYASTLLTGPTDKAKFGSGAMGTVTETIQILQQALLASKIISYAQGFMLLQEISKSRKWNLHFANIAKVWRGGCIIRSVFLDRIAEAYTNNLNIANLLVDPYFAKCLDKSQNAWRRTISFAVESGIPVPALSSALSFYDGYRCSTLPANMIQALRDYFGAHGYEKIDTPRGTFFHTDWIGSGSSTTSGYYNA